MSRGPNQPDEEPEIADAAWLVRDSSGPPGGDRPERPPAAPSAPGEGYDVIGGDEAVGSPETPPRPPIPPRPTAPPESRRRARPEGDEARGEVRAPAARVDQVWSRWSEWGPTIVLLAIVGLAVIGLVYATFDVANLALPLMILFAGGLILLALSYPLVITLERPVRLTPEQAVKDYYGALSHHLPHYRRMWLLLSSDGRTSGEYGSFEGFKAYWKRRLSELRGNAVPGSTPLVFTIEDFKSEKSAGKSEIEVRYTVRVFARGRRHQDPLATIRCTTTLVRGPDRMWYLNQGTLPRERG